MIFGLGRLGQVGVMPSLALSAEGRSLLENGTMELRTLAFGLGETVRLDFANGSNAEPISVEVICGETGDLSVRVHCHATCTEGRCEVFHAKMETEAQATQRVAEAAFFEGLLKAALAFGVAAYKLDADGKLTKVDLTGDDQKQAGPVKH